MDPADVSAIAALEDDIRRALYEHVRTAGAPVTREQAAAAVGISRKLAAFHLDKLVDLGLLRSGFGSGPRRVGRTPRSYEPGERDICVQLPERSPDVLAAILVEAVTGARSSERADQAAVRVAREHGVAAGAAHRERVRPGRLGTERALSLGRQVVGAAGYQPYRSADGVRMRNCPFHPLAARSPAFVCGLNQAYLAGVVEGLGAAGRIRADLAPAPGECCVELRPIET